jgi:cyclophilin family peptidyl-prolyl cis-trans isomerase
MKKLSLIIAVILCTVAAQAQTQKVVIETDSGKIVLALTDNTPLHRDNMVKLVREKFYDSLLFHRVIAGFVVQGGDPDSKRAEAGKMLGEGDLGYKVPAEINDSNYHHRGALGMARDNNPEKASSACQFYIVTGKVYKDAELDRAARGGRVITPAQREVYKTQGGTAMLDGGYTVYGYVVEGMDVVDKISAMPGDQANRPNTDIRMNRVYMWGEDKPEKGKKKKDRKKEKK